MKGGNGSEWQILTSGFTRQKRQQDGLMWILHILNTEE